MSRPAGADRRGGAPAPRPRPPRRGDRRHGLAAVDVDHAAPGALYLAGVVGLRRSGRAWRAWRTITIAVGLVLVAAALFPPVEAAATGARGHLTQHLLLGMYAPLALVLGAPATLLLAALPVRSRPRVAAVLTVGGLYLLYLTPLYTLSARSALVHHPLHVHFLLAGYLFAWAVAGPDPAPRRPGMGCGSPWWSPPAAHTASWPSCSTPVPRHYHPAAATARPRWNWPASGCTKAGTWLT